MNERWHSAHQMPQSPTVDERVGWHEEHARECACRPIPGAIKKEIRRRERETRAARLARERLVERGPLLPSS